MTDRRFFPLIMLVAMGVLWGITQPLSKIAVAGGYRDIGIIFWQFAVAILVLGTINLIRRKQLLSLRPVHLGIYLMIATIGTILPNWASFTAAVHLPSGILSIVIATVPMMAFPIAMALGMDRFSVLRLLGLLLGLSAIVMIAAPQSSLPDPSLTIWVAVALIAPLFYAIEGNVVAKWGTAGLDPVQVLFGSASIGILIAGPLAVATGEFISPLGPWGLADWSVFGIALAHTTAYTAYVWLVGRTGAVFASQVGYLVTGFGVVWAMVLLGERYSGWIWGALVLMLIGVALVQPRTKPSAPPAPAPSGQL